MPDFDFTSPDGKQYTVSGPAGSTPEQAFQMLQTQLGTSNPTNNVRIGNAADQIPLPQGARQSMQAESASRPAYEPSFMDKVTGAGEAARSVVSGMTSGAVGYIGGALGGIAGSIANGDFGTEQGLRRAKEEAEASAANLTYQPRTKLGQQYTQNVAEAFNDSGVAGLPIGPELNAIGTLAGPAVKQGATGIKNSTEVYIAQKLAEKSANIKLTPKIEMERAQLAQKAADIGIEAPLHTLTDNKYARLAGEFLDNLPLSGSAKADNESAFAKSLIAQIGGNAQKFDKLTPTIFSEAMAKSGGEIGKVFSKIAVPFEEPALQADLSALRSTLPRVLSDTEKVIVGYMDELQRLADGNGGNIPGKSLKDLHSDVLLELRGKAVDNYPGMRDRLSDFQSILEDAADRQITNPADKALYQTARVQYAKAKTLEPLVARGGIKGVSPQALLAQLNSTSAGKHRMAIGAAGELGDLAQIAQNFMKELPSSGTAERSAAISAVMAPVRAGIGMVAGNAYNRIARPIARAAVRNTIDDIPSPVRFGAEPLALADEPTFSSRPAPVNAPYNGILTAEQEPIQPIQQSAPDYVTAQSQPSINFPLLETQPMPIQRSGERLSAPVESGPGLAYDNGIDFHGNQAAPAPVAIADNGLMSLAEPAQSLEAPRIFPQAGGNTIDFPLRQEVLQQPEISASVNAFRAEAARLQQIATNAISPPVRQKAMGDLVRLQENFASGMRQLGIRSPQEAIGLQPIFESGVTPRLEVQSTFDPRGYQAPAVRARVNAERTRLQLQRIGEATTIDEAIQAASGQ